MWSALLAHAGEHVNSFEVGFFHPIHGLDHLLAMVTVGFLSARLSAKYMWTLPAAFVVFMAAGGLLGLVFAPQGLTAFEWGISGSVLIFGLLVALAPKVNVYVGNVIVAVFAICHGHAHVAEMGDASVTGYFTGMFVATALLHIAGLVAGLAMTRWVGDWIVRVAAGFVIVLLLP